jgi:hypothetical protein
MRSTSLAGQNRRLLPVLLGFFFFNLLAAAAQDLPSAKPESVGLSSERLERIGGTIQREIDDKRITGTVTLGTRSQTLAHCWVLLVNDNFRLGISSL